MTIRLVYRKMGASAIIPPFYARMLKISEMVIRKMEKKLDFMPILGPYSNRQAGIA